MSYYERKIFFINEIKKLLALAEISQRAEKIKYVFEIFQAIDDNADIVFNPNNCEFVRFAQTVKYKLLEFERSEPELKERCQAFLKKHYSTNSNKVTDDDVFISTLKDLMNKCTWASKKDQYEIIIKILDLMEKYSDLVFNTDSVRYNRFAATVKQKLLEFSEEEEELKTKCEEFLKKYYNIPKPKPDFTPLEI